MMTAVARKANTLTERTKVSAPLLRQPKERTKPKLNLMKAMMIWAKWFALPTCLSIAWCLLNALIVNEAKMCELLKKQIRVVEMKSQQLQASIALRVSELTENSNQLTPNQQKLTLLSLRSPGRQATLLGRR